MRLRWTVITALLIRVVTAVPIDEQDVGSLQPLVDVIRPLIIKASLLVGGLFGIYTILLAFRVYYERKNQILLEKICYDLDHLNQHFGVSSSRERVGFWHKWLLDKLLPGHLLRHHDNKKKSRFKK